MPTPKTPQDAGTVPRVESSSAPRLLRKKAVLYSALTMLIAYGSRFFDWGVRIIDWLERYDYIAGRNTKSYEILTWLVSPRGTELMFFLSLVVFVITILFAVNPRQPSGAEPRPRGGEQVSAESGSARGEDESGPRAAGPALAFRGAR